MTNFFQGATVRIRVTFENGSHVETDPATITAKVEDPSGVTTTYTYPASVFREATGIYYVDVDLDEAGVWSYRFESTGAVKAASQDTLMCIAAKPA